MSAELLVSKLLQSKVTCLCSSPDLVPKDFSKPVLCLNGKKRRRFRCLRCNRVFCENLNRLNYRLKHPDRALNFKIFSLLFHGSSNRNIARSLGVSEHCVRTRLRRMAQRAFDFHSIQMNSLFVREELCYDGLENFAGSQYDPNNINHIIGRDSLFIYDFSFASLNRKGRMSSWQRNRLRQIEKQSGRYNPRAIRLATTRLLKRVHTRCENSYMRLLSDEHFQYRRSLRLDLPKLAIDHEMVSSKACRNFQNILFSVNHADLVIRQRLASFSRETISFSKSAGAMCQRYILFMIYKNYMCPQFTKKHVHRPEAHQKSPAECLELTDKICDFADIFTLRSPIASQSLNEEWRYFYHGSILPEQKRDKKFVRAA